METLSVTTTLTVTVAEVRMFTDSASSEAADAAYKNFSALAQAMENWNSALLVFMTVMSFAGAVFAFFGYRNYKEWREAIDERVKEIARKETVQAFEDVVKTGRFQPPRSKGRFPAPWSPSGARTAWTQASSSLKRED